VLQDGSGLHIPSMTIYRNNELKVPWTTTEIATKDLQTIVRFYITPLVAQTNHLIVNTRRILILLVNSSHFKICNHAYVYNFKFYFTLLSKNFSPFPHGTCLLSGFRFIFSFGRNLSPDSHCTIKQYYSLQKFYKSNIDAFTGLSPSMD
jgi:sensor histidine kinase YesM